MPITIGDQLGIATAHDEAEDRKTPGDAIVLMQAKASAGDVLQASEA